MTSMNDKENVRDLLNALDLIKKFEPVIYDIRENRSKSQKNVPGLLAEEVLEFYPELVKKSEKGDIIGINYIQIISILIAAVKEMDIKMNQMKNRINRLETKENKINDSDLSFLNIFKK